MTLAAFKSKDDSQGVKVCISEEAKCFLYIRRTSNRDYQNAIRRKMKEARPATPQENGNKYSADRDRDPQATVIAAILDAITPEDRKKLAAEYILVGWENLTDDFGDFRKYQEEGSKRIRYSKEAALALLTHERYQGFYDLVMEIANDESVFREERVKEEAGNSLTASGGGSKTASE